MSGAQNNSEANFTDLALFFHLLKLIIKPAFLWSDNKYFLMKLLKVHLFTLLFSASSYFPILWYESFPKLYIITTYT